MPSSIRLLLANALRVVHIALWMTIPATLLLWLNFAEVPVECVPEYGWYGGNVLCVSEDTYFFIVFGILLLGSLAVDLWILGYMVEAVGRLARGDGELPPVRLNVIAAGCGLVWASLRFWLPFIAFVLGIRFMVNGLPHRVALQAFDAVMLAALPLMAVMLWGNLVGAARYAIQGDRSLICRRRENVRTALVNFKPSLALILLLPLVTKLGLRLWEGLNELSVLLDGLNLMTAAALGSFTFFLLLLCWSIACSYLVARYARAVGIGDNLKPGANGD